MSERHYAIDFDAVISKYDGWKGKGVFGDPLPGVHKALQRIRESGGKIIIFTTRLETDRIEGYLSQHNIPFDYINYSPLTTTLHLHPNKVMAHVYIDDRGVTFRGKWDEEFVDQVLQFKAYWEKA